MNIITISEIILIIAAFFIIIKIVQKNNADKERDEISWMKKRNSDLDKKLRNPEIHVEHAKESKPIEVRYRPGEEEVGRIGKILELEVHTSTSIQKYLFDMSKPVTIGKSADNLLVIHDEYTADHHAVIRLKQKQLCVQNVSHGDAMLLKRGNHKINVVDQMIKVQHGDEMQIGCTKICLSAY